MSAADADVGIEIHRIEGAETERALEMVDRRIRFVEIGVQPTTPVPSPSRVQVQSQCPFQQSSSDIVTAYDRVGGRQYCQDGGILPALCGSALRQAHPLGSRLRRLRCP